MSGYINYFDDGRCIKYFDDGGKNISLRIENDNVLLKYNEIWTKIKKTLNIKLHIQPVYDEKYIKTKVKAFYGAVNTMFWNEKI